MIVYISGKITGLKNYKKYFRKAEKKLNRMGYKTFNPCCIPSVFPSWRNYMEIDLKALEQCDAIYMLSNWQDSLGAKVELERAKDLRKVILFENIQDTCFRSDEK